MARVAGSGTTAGFRAPSKQEYSHRQGTNTREQTGGIPGLRAGGRQERAKTLGEGAVRYLKNQILLNRGRKFTAIAYKRKTAT